MCLALLAGPCWILLLIFRSRLSIGLWRLPLQRFRLGLTLFWIWYVFLVSIQHVYFLLLCDSDFLFLFIADELFVSLLHRSRGWFVCLDHSHAVFDIFAHGDLLIWLITCRWNNLHGPVNSFWLFIEALNLFLTFWVWKQTSNLLVGWGPALLDWIRALLWILVLVLVPNLMQILPTASFVVERPFRF